MLRLRIIKQVSGLASAALVGLLALWTPVALATPTSTNYRLQELSVGGVGNSGSASSSFQQIQNSGGTLGNGNASSANNQIKAGAATTPDPTLSFAITSGTVGFTEFSAATTATATATFEVSNYTSYGYVVTIIGTPPTSGLHTLTAMNSTGPSQAGVEQFGINLVANTSPTSLGANPDHGQFGFGSAASGYGTTNNYRYVSGETIAIGPKSGGTTVYTISYIVNVTGRTAGGQYSGSQTIICTGTF